ncbi:MAG: hypothetical protein JYX80_06150 [Candidatus Scalindua sediminis]|nr:hypothetical protein [Candidatus Scalindua sediminis]
MSINNSELYQSKGNSVYLWKFRSQELFDAAFLVWEGKVIRTKLPNGEIDETHELYRPAQLLMGMSLEVLLKGLIVQKNPDLIDSDKLPKDLSTHSLEKLFEDASINLEDNEDELNFIRKLSDAVEWVAKYPIPLHANHLKQPKHRSSSLMIRNDLDFERFKKLRTKIESCFAEET